MKNNTLLFLLLIIAIMLSIVLIKQEFLVKLSINFFK
jgi:hypothetical protein